MKKVEQKINQGEEGKNDDDKDKGPPPKGNGGATDIYVWTQTLEEALIKLH